MTRLQQLSIAFAVLISSPLVAAEASADVAPAQLSKEQQREQLLALYPGTYSNFFPSTRDPDAVASFPPVVQRVRSAKLDTGETVLLVEQRFLHESQYFRRQVYRFVVESRLFSSEQTLVQHTFAFSENSAEPVNVEQPIALADLQRLPGCEVKWTQQNGAYEGYRDPEQCYFQDESGAQIYFESQLRVEPERVSVIETLYDAAREPLETAEGGSGGAMVSEPIRFFDMTVTFLPSGANGENDNEWIAVEGDKRVHDHGQRINLRTVAEQQLLPYQVQVTKHAEHAEVLTIRVYALGEEQPIHQWQIAAENGRWFHEELPLRVELREADYHGTILATDED